MEQKNRTEIVVKVSDEVEAVVKCDEPRYGARRVLKDKLFVWGVEDVDDVAKDLLERSIASDTPKEWNPLNRKLAARRKEWLGKLEEAFTPEFVESLKYSSKAGCSCGCSPGYTAATYHNREYYVHFRPVAERTMADLAGIGGSSLIG
jgi:hypothetical protein